MKKTVLLAVIAAAVLTAVVGEPSSLKPLPTTLVMSDRVLEDLRVFAAGMENEMILCLNGRVRGDTAIIDRWRMPRLEVSTPVSAKVAGDGCDPRRDLATWHNHPTGARTQLMALQLGSPVGGNLCYLSETDTERALSLRMPFQVLHAGGDHWCWWTLAEIEAFSDSGHARGRPAPGHEHGAFRSPLSKTVR